MLMRNDLTKEESEERVFKSLWLKAIICMYVKGYSNTHLICGRNFNKDLDQKDFLTHQLL